MLIRSNIYNSLKYVIYICIIMTYKCYRMKIFNLLVAKDSEGGIGKNNNLPWRCRLVMVTCYETTYHPHDELSCLII